MFQLAIDARIPIISVTTGDLVNLEATLEHYVDASLARAGDLNSLLLGIKKCEFTYMVAPTESNWVDIYHKIAQIPNREPVVIVVNQEDSDSSFFDAGPLPTPKALLRQLLSKCADKAGISDLLRVLAGVSLKEASELVALATAEYGELTPRAVSAARRAMPINLHGLSIVDTDYAHYMPDSGLDGWLGTNGKVFLMNGSVHPNIVPRGLLLKGDSGTGKTMAAKYIGNRLGLSVYRLDIAASLNKYIGQSEGNVRAALDHVETLAPCLLFMDEVEKIFRKDDDSGTSNRILSTILWWLQEHKHRILTVMTCNDDAHMPIELTRKGRLDETFTLHGFDNDSDKLHFIEQELIALEAEDDCIEFAKEQFQGLGTETSQAALAQWAHQIMRDWLLME